MTQPTQELITRRVQTARLCRQQARRPYTPAVEQVRASLRRSEEKAGRWYETMKTAKEAANHV